MDDESEFRRAVTGNLLTNQIIDISELKDSIFNPFELNDMDGNSPQLDNDPDIQFYNEINNNYKCDYILEDNFNSACEKLSMKSNNFSLIHLNIRSMSKNSEKFVAYISNLQIDFDIICMTETWLKQTNIELQGIDSYVHISQYRASRPGGGVSVFLKEHFSFKRRKDLEVNNSYLETVFLELPKEEIGHKQNVLIGVIYRQPNSEIDAINTHLTSILNAIKLENKIAYIAGDFNINLLNVESSEKLRVH